MRRVFLFILMFAILCMAAPAALAEQDYTEVSGIPMAVDFSVRVDFDETGRPHVITDYPFEQTGAKEMNLVYTINGEEAFTLRYQHSTGTTSIGSWDPRLLGSDSEETAYQMIRSGEAALDDHVYIGTTHFSQETDWVLVYSLSEQRYVQYAERTFAQAFNAMGDGGVERTVYYYAGRIDSSRLLKRTENADLIVSYNEYGEMTSGMITVYQPQTADYHFDETTGLFGGRPITELGFEESDLRIPVLAALDGKTTTSVAVQQPPPVKTGDGFSYTTAFGLIVGILIGLTLYYCFRRKKKTPDKPEKTEDNTGESVPSVQEEVFDSAPKTFSSGK